MKVMWIRASVMAIILLVVYGDADGGNSAALVRFLKQQLKCTGTLPPAIRVMVEQPGSPPDVHVDCNPKHMTPTKLQATARQQKQIPDLGREDADLGERISLLS